LLPNDLVTLTAFDVTYQNKLAALLGLLTSPIVPMLCVGTFFRRSASCSVAGDMTQSV